MIKTFLNPEEHQNRIRGSKVTAILLKGWILPIGEASSVEGLRSTGLPRLVSSSLSSSSSPLSRDEKPLQRGSIAVGSIELFDEFAEIKFQCFGNL